MCYACVNELRYILTQRNPMCISNDGKETYMLKACKKVFLFRGPLFKKWSKTMIKMLSTGMEIPRKTCLIFTDVLHMCYMDLSNK